MMSNNSIKQSFSQFCIVFGLSLCLSFVDAGYARRVQRSLIRYPSVEQQAEYPRGLSVSTYYRVLAKPASDTTAWNVNAHLTATYEAWPDYLDPESIPWAYRDIAVHFAQVDANQRIRFRVEVLKGTIDTLSVRPSRYIETQASLQQGGTWLEFEVDTSDLTKHILVEINEPKNSQVLNHGLMVFLNPMTTLPRGKVLKLPSGIITPERSVMSDDRCIHIDSDSSYDTLFIPMDTVVDGRVQVHKKGFTVTGRGIVCGSYWKHAKQDNWSNHYPITRDHKVVKGLCDGAGDTTFEGVTTVHPYHFNFTGAETYINLKAFGWRFSSDGFHGKYIHGCFAKTNDDHQYTNHGVVERGSYWGMDNGGIFQLGWGKSAIAQGGNCHVKSCNVLRSEWIGPRKNNGVFSGVLNAGGTMQNNLFEDIRIDGQCFRFFSYKLGSGVTLKNFTFKDIWFEKPFGTPQGYEKAGSPATGYLTAGKGITGFVFDNVVIGGKKVSRLEDLGPMQTDNLGEVTFK